MSALTAKITREHIGGVTSYEGDEAARIARGGAA